MAGTKEGARKAVQKILKSDPEFYHKIGKKGGENGTGHKFAHGKVSPVEAGLKGGKVTKDEYNA